nr:apolipoprotein N-acyltransferase [Novosphingobium huizhouense]
MLLPLGLGGLAATGFQPLALWPATLAALAAVMALVERARGPGYGFLRGWLFGVGLFTVGNSWIATAFTYQAQMPAWLGWVAVVLLALYLAVFPAMAALAAWLLSHRLRAAIVPAFAGCWIVTEWMRAWVFTGFAWNPLGAAALGGFDRPGLASVAAWTGTYALSGLVVLLAGQCLFAWRCLAQGKRRAGAVHATLPVVLFLLPLAPQEEPGTLRYTLVQPDLPQDEINDPRQFESQFQRIARLSLPRAPGQPRLVLWPESGIPDYLREGYAPFWYAGTTYAGDPALARARIGRVIGPGSLLLTGAVDLAQDRRGTVNGAWNVVTAVDPAGAIRGSYAKAHLVPYGEYLPMRAWLTPLGLSRLVAGELDYFAGPGPRTIDFGPYGKTGFQICYEIIFSGEVVDRRHRPDYIFNPSNDGWFGSSGPPQHLAQARLRAIEEGLPVLRATTTGISAVIDSNGVVRQHVGRNVAGRLEGIVPRAHAATPFARAGNGLALGWAAVLLVIAVVARRRGVG